ncbi:DUF5992 family protein [Microbulbifer sp. DLAB2-AA]|uniref:DUF5992 family protein n=1 Tax=Microbulbifer sp. DLAB2-AA TaxID=3243394 RepID=UPI004039BDB5
MSYHCDGVFRNVLAAPGYIAQDIEIVSVANMDVNVTSFTLKTANATGIWSGESITFPLSITGDAGNNESIHQHAYSRALMA